MDIEPGCVKRVRRLYDWEIAEASYVFGSSLRYDKVLVHECATWTDAIDRLGRRLKKMPPGTTHNAVTIGFNCYFPVQLPETRPDDIANSTMSWLIHELTHAWQYQHMGWGYLYLALSAQFRLGARAYDFGGPAALAALRSKGWTLRHFNPEQQGDICRTYYICRCENGDTSNWLPYINDLARG